MARRDSEEFVRFHLVCYLEAGHLSITISINELASKMKKLEELVKSLIEPSSSPANAVASQYCLGGESPAETPDTETLEATFQLEKEEADRETVKDNSTEL